MANLAFNPMQTVNGLGGFNVQSDGYVQGTAMDDPAIRNALAGGQIAAAATLPMWGGIGITELINAGSPLNINTLDRAANFAALTGFSVFDQAHNLISSPQSNVPSAASGMTINFYRFGSGARIALAMDPALVSLDGQLITSQISWDFTNQRVVAFATNALPVKILDFQVGNCKTVTYDAGANTANWNNSGSCILVQI